MVDYIKIFPQILGVKSLDYIPDTQIESWKKYIKSNDLFSILEKYKQQEESKDFISNNQKLLDEPIFKHLKNKILEYSKEYVSELGIPFEDLQISTSWAYVAYSNNVEGNFHDHANSLVSGVFYLTKGGDLGFESSFYKNLNFKTLPTSISQAKKHKFQIKIKEKLLVLFPSYLFHAIMTNDTDCRISIPFNIIPKGEFGIDASKLYL